MSKAEKDQIIADAKLHFMDSMAEIYKSKLKDNFTAHTEFYLGECLGYRIPYMQNQGASDKEIEAYYNKNADYPGLFQNYTSYLAETEQYDKLFKTIQENDYRKNEFSLFNMYFNQNEYYQVIFDNINSIVYLDNIQDYFKELFEIFIQECRLDHTVLEILLLFREYAPPQKFEEFIEYIYNSKKIDMLRKAYIAAAYQDYDRLADFVLDSKSSPELFDLYYDKLYKRFPDRVQDRYAELLQNTPSFAKNRPEYRHIINHLEAITNDFPNGKETAQMIGQNWRRDFKRKRALHDELSKAGF